jgi:hypothetical protein
MRLRALPIAVVLSLLATAVPAERPVYWIASGEKGKTYHDVYGRNLKSYLREFKLMNRPTSGSGENLDQLEEGRAQLGFVQADVYAARVEREPGRYGELLVVGKLAPECVYVAYRKGGTVQGFSQLAAPATGPAPKIAVGAKQGGMAATWSYMTTLIPSLAGVEVVYEGGGNLSLTQLAAGGFDAVAWVTDPENHAHLLAEGVNANDDLAFMSVSDPALEHALPDGTVVYEARSVKTAQGVFAGRVRTICTTALLMARRDAPPTLLEKVADLLSLDRDKILGRAHLGI